MSLHPIQFVDGRMIIGDQPEQPLRVEDLKIKPEYSRDKELSLLHVYATNRLAQRKIRLDTFMLDPSAVLWAVLNNAARQLLLTEPDQDFLPLLPAQEEIRQSLFSGIRHHPRHRYPGLRKLCAQWYRLRRRYYATGCRFHDVSPTDAVAYFMLSDAYDDCAEDLKAYLES